MKYYFYLFVAGVDDDLIISRDYLGFRLNCGSSIGSHSLITGHLVFKDIPS